jgi:S1-C subfamily serine protease
VAIGEHQVLVAPFRLPATWRVTAGQNQAHRVTRVALDAVHGVAVLAVEGPPLVPLQLAGDSAALDEPVVAMAVGRDVRAPLPTILDPPMTYNRLKAQLAPGVAPGEITVDLDGTLLAYGAASPATATVLTAPELAAVVSALQATGRHTHPWTGVHLQTIDEPLRARFPAGAIVVVDVAAGAGAPRELVPGTALSEVRAGGSIATTEEAAARAIASADLATYVRIDGRAFDVPVIDRQLPELFDVEGAGATLTGSLPALTVAPMSRAAASGLRTGDVVRAIDLRPVRSAAQVEAAMRGSRERLLTIQRGETRRFVLWTAGRAEQAR